MPDGYTASVALTAIGCGSVSGVITWYKVDGAMVGLGEIPLESSDRCMLAVNVAVPAAGLGCVSVEV